MEFSEHRGKFYLPEIALPDLTEFRSAWGLPSASWIIVLKTLSRATSRHPVIRSELRPWWWELQGEILGRRIVLDGAVEHGNPYGANLRCP